MKESFKLKDIESATGISVQRLRYVLDQGILPGSSGPSWSRGRGSPRSFTPFEAFGIVCAALLLGAGLRRRAVKDCLEILCTSFGDRRDVASVPLYQAFQQRAVASLEIGDGDYVRLIGSEDYRRRPLIFAWRQISTKRDMAMCEPLVTVRVDVAKLRRHLQG